MRILKFIGLLMVGMMALQPRLCAQTSYGQRLPLEVVQVSRYALAPSKLRPFTFQMDFASARITPSDTANLSTTSFQQIDLVFTLYPKQPENWKVGYDSLLERRFRTLEQVLPSVFRDPDVKWRLVIQTGCHSLAQAQGMFHGFVLYPAEKASIAKAAVATDDSVIQDSIRVMRFDTVKLREKFTLVTKILSGEKVIPDSTTINVLERHPEWKNALVVVDWTASIYRQGAMVVRWQQEHLAESRIRHFVFFNDGDQLYDDEKTVGATGGIYQIPADSIHRLMATLEAVTMGGEGGDHRENNLEAVLEGIASCPTCEEVILIADNSGPVRDMALLELVDRPVHVLLCGVYKDEIETDYLEIVDQTKGSLHTRDRDLTDLEGLLVKGILTLGDKQYTRKGKHWCKYEPRF